MLNVTYPNENNFSILVMNNYSSYSINATEEVADVGLLKETFLIHEILLIVFLLIFSKFGSVIIKRCRIQVLNESLLAVLVGLIGGQIISSLNIPNIINSVTKGYLKVFIIFLLPPIIFESAYNIKKKEFYKNVGTILLYAVVGTLISIVFIGYFIWKLGVLGFFKGFNFQQSLAYGALISATDPVCIISAFKEYSTDQNFYLLVFGESILNDAVSMVFYDSVAEYEAEGSTLHKYIYPTTQFLFILIGSTFVGMILGFVASYIVIKVSEAMKSNNRIQIGILLSFPWLSYLTAHIMNLSAIVVIFFMGISLSVYLKPFVSKVTEEVVHKVYEEVSSIAESTVFVFIGLSFFADHPYQDLTFALPFYMIVLCLIGRLLNVVVCSYFANRYRVNNNQIGLKKQFFLWFSGVRGAMAFALALKSKFDFPEIGSMFLLITLLITAFTLLYSSFFLNVTLNECGIMVDEHVNEENIEQSFDNVPNLFQDVKEKLFSLHALYLMPLVVVKANANDNPRHKLIEDSCSYKN